MGALNPANCARLSREGWHVAADSPAPVPPSDTHLPDDQRPLRRSDPADFRTQKQGEPGGLPTPVTRIGRRGVSGCGPERGDLKRFLWDFTYLCWASMKPSLSRHAAKIVFLLFLVLLADLWQQLTWLALGLDRCEATSAAAIKRQSQLFLPARNVVGSRRATE